VLGMGYLDKGEFGRKAAISSRVDDLEVWAWGAGLTFMYIVRV